MKYFSSPIKMLTILRKAHRLSKLNSIPKKLLLPASGCNCALTYKRELSVTSGQRQILKSSYPDVAFSGRNFFELMWSATEKHGDRTALVDAVSGREVNYEDAQRMSRNFGLHLRAAGATKADILALFLPNCVEYPMVFSGASAAGVTVTTLNPIYTAPEIAKQLKLSNSTYAVTTKELFPIMKAATDALDSPFSWKGRIFIVGDSAGMDDCPSVSKLLTTDVPGDLDADIDVHNDICVLPYSSGTTGLPKGVMLTHNNMVANVEQTGLSVDEIRMVQDTNGSYQAATVSVLPMYHAFAMNVTMTPALFSGAKLVVLPKFDSAGFVRAIKKYRPTFLHLAPPLVSFVASHPDLTADDLFSLDHIVAAAAPSGPELIKKFKARAPNAVYREGWGMTETSPIVTMTPMNKDKERNGSCGVLVPNTEVKIVDINTGKILGPGERGELCCRGPQIMKGYLNNPEATEGTLKDGWLHSGDIAIYDEDGYVYIVDRLKELIKVKGFQVPPAELEDLLRGHPKVQDVAVIGVPHEKFGEAPRAYVVGKKGEVVSGEEIAKFVAENVAAYKHLVGGVEVMDAIPKSAAGKILRKELVARYNEAQK